MTLLADPSRYVFRTTSYDLQLIDEVVASMARMGIRHAKRARAIRLALEIAVSPLKAPETQTVSATETVTVEDAARVPLRQNNLKQSL